VLILDGYDAQAIGYVAPALVKAWHLDRSALGPMFTSGLIGLAAGGLVFGPLADRFGRKIVLLASVAVFGVLTLLKAWATSIEALTVLQFIGGLGLGGAAPNVVALMAEYFPRRRQAAMGTVAMIGMAAGSVAGGLVAAALLPRFGWTSVFYVGGLVPLLMLPFLFAWLPESIRLMVLLRRPSDDIARILARINPSLRFPAGTIFVTSETKQPGFSVTHLFREGRALKTSLLWLAMFANLMALYFLISWLPTLLNTAGLSLERSSFATALFPIGGVVGGILLARLLGRFAAPAVLGLAFLFSTICTGLIGVVDQSFPLLLDLPARSTRPTPARPAWAGRSASVASAPSSARRWAAFSSAGTGRSTLSIWPSPFRFSAPPSPSI
jgi:AAHS family 4-hydroxybenzoate transporter-like MFS transporter